MPKIIQVIYDGNHYRTLGLDEEGAVWKFTPEQLNPFTDEVLEKAAWEKLIDSPGVTND